MNKIIWALGAILCLLSSCTKEKDIVVDAGNYGQVKIKLDHIVGGKKLILHDYLYSNKSNESFHISLLKYYISNIKLYKSTGEVVTIPKQESFFLVDASDDSTLQPTVEVPTGEYIGLEFNLGVDSLTNTLPIEQRTGVLDVSKHGMYWEWNSGYIHFKLEGTSEQAPNINQAFKYHIGFFGGYTTPTVNNNRTIRIDLSKAGKSKVQESLSSDIHLMVDIGKIFDGPNTISINTTPVVMTSGPHSAIADNYATMFTHDHTHNYQKIVRHEK